jgi:PKD repeat protein
MKLNLQKLTLLFVLLSLQFSLFSQCVLVPLDLKQRVQASELIIEGMVVDKQSYWNDEKTMIYTANTIQLSRVYKGSEWIGNTSRLELITLGGTVGLNALKVSPELSLEMGDIGIFMLVQKDQNWVSESGPQGFIKIDKHNGTSADMYTQYPRSSIEKEITSITSIPVVIVNENLTKITFSSKRAAPSISSISPTTLTSGTSTVLTIKGSNFKSTRDTSSVQFRDADKGGLSFIKALKRDYISWTDTQIRVLVRTTAGTGKIRVVVGGNGNIESTDTLKVTYAHSNVVLGDTIAYENQLIGLNQFNGITWKMNRRFFDSTGARGAFLRSIERWRCGTLVNWDTLGRLNHSAIKRDKVNMCGWDTSNAMPSGVLAQCFSWYAGCFTPGLVWYTEEMDIRFRVKPTSSTNWLYTTGNANNNQFHFESVATHELGHGHQLGHVISSPVVMHFAIANGQTKPNLTTNDINCGTYVINKSGTAVCGRQKHNKITQSTCTLVAPLSNFTYSKVQPCKDETIQFTDSSVGNVSAYVWDFGSGATPATANTKGPHSVKYSNGGSKTVSLKITTGSGDLTRNKTFNVASDSKIKPTFTYTVAEQAKVSFVNTSNNALSSEWVFGDGDSAFTLNANHTYNNGGVYQVKLKTQNLCNTHDTTVSIKISAVDFVHSEGSFCIGKKLVFQDASDNNASSWQWTFPGGIPATANGKGPHAVQFSSAGAVSATLTVGVTGSPNHIYTKTALATIGNDTFSNANFTYVYQGSNGVGFVNLSKGSSNTYKWNFGDGDSSNQKNPSHRYSNANNQMVRLTATGVCNTHDTTIALRNFTNLGSLETNNKFKIVPNPSNGIMMIAAPKNELVSLELYDAMGRRIVFKKVITNVVISDLGLAKGMYVVKVSQADYTETLKCLVD